MTSSVFKVSNVESFLCCNNGGKVVNVIYRFIKCHGGVAFGVLLHG